MLAAGCVVSATGWLFSTRKHYMGRNFQSGDLGQQYAAASHYVHDRYGSWSNAKRFWQAHRWY